MLAPPAFLCVTTGHPEDILGAVLCVAAVLLAQRGSVQAAGFMLGLALINKSWAIIAAPLVFAVMPADRRLRGFGTAVVVTAAGDGPRTRHPHDGLGWKRYRDRQLNRARQLNRGASSRAHSCCGSSGATPGSRAKATSS